MKKSRRKLEFSADLRRSAGNVMFTVAAALAVFLLVDSYVDVGKHITTQQRVWYIIITVLLFTLGALLLNSIKHKQDDKIRFIVPDPSVSWRVHLDNKVLNTRKDQQKK